MGGGWDQGGLPFVTFRPKPENDAARALAEERRRADAEMALRYANLTMPEDIRCRAKAWGMEAFCEVLWNNAFQAGFREAMRGRDRGADETP